MWPPLGAEAAGGSAAADAATACRLSLAGVSANAEVFAAVAHVSVNYTYSNDLGQGVEDALLSLTVPENAVLLGFEVFVASSSAWRGEVRPREAASDAADAAGKDKSSEACLASGSTADAGPYAVGGGAGAGAASAAAPVARQLNIGRVRKGEGVVLRMDYVQELRSHVRPGRDAALRLVLPVPSVARKRAAIYGGHGNDGKSRAPALTLQLRMSGGPRGAAANAELTSSITGVKLKMKAPKEDAAGNLLRTATVTSETVQDVSVDISVAREEVDPEAALIAEAARHPSTGRIAFALALPADLPSSATFLPPAPRYEVALVIDRSASMRGVRMQRVQKAAQTLLQSIPHGALFNIIGLSQDDDASVALFAVGSKALDAETFRTASEHIAKAESPANKAPTSPASKAGSTAKHLLEVALGDHAAGRARGTQLRVLFLTDRAPPDGEAAAKFLAERCLDDCQVAALGLGWGASVPFVEALAKAGRGSAAFVAERGGAAALERQLVAQLTEGLQPMVHRLSVTLVDAQSLASAATREPEPKAALANFWSSAPAAASLAGSGRLLALGFLPDVDVEAAGLPSLKLRIKATVNGQQLEADVRLDIAAAAMHNGTALHALAGRYLSEQPSGEEADWSFSVGLTYGLETRRTRWVAVRSTAAGEAEAAATSREEELREPPRPCSLETSGASGASQRSTDGSSRASLAFRHPLRPAASSTAAPALAMEPACKFGATLSAFDFSKLGASLALRPLGQAFGRAPGATAATNFYPPLDRGRAAAGAAASSATAGSSGSTSAAAAAAGTAPLAAAKPAATLPSAAAAGVPLRGAFRHSGAVSVTDSGCLGGSLSVGGQSLLSTAATKRPGSQADDPLAWESGLLDESLLDPSGRLSSASSRSAPLRLEDSKVKVTRNAARLSHSIAVADPQGFRHAPRPTAPAAAAATSASATAKNDGGASAAKVLGQLSVLDFASLGSTLSLRNLPGAAGAFPGAPGGGRGAASGYGYRGGSLSALDYLFLGSSLSLGSFGYDRRRADFAASGAAGASAADSLAVRSFSRLSASLSVLGPAASVGASPALGDLEASARRLSAVNFEHLGASLALRSLKTSGRGAGRMAGPLPRALQQQGGAFASGGGAAGSYPAAGSAGAAAGSGEPGAGRGGGDAFVVADGARSAARADASRGPAGWIALGVAGGLAAPLLAIWRQPAAAADACQPASEVATVRLQVPGVDVAQFLSFYSAQDVLLAGESGGAGSPFQGGELIGRAAVPSRGEKSGGSRKRKAGSELQLDIRISRACELSVYEHQEKSSTGSSAKDRRSLASDPYGFDYGYGGLGDAFGDDPLFGGAAGGEGGDREALLGPIALPLRPAQRADEDPEKPAASSTAAVAAEDDASGDEPAPDASTVDGSSQREERLRDALGLRRMVLANGGVPLTGELPLDAKRGGATGATSSGSAGPAAAAATWGAVAATDDYSGTYARYRALLAAQRVDGAFDLEAPGAEAAASDLSALLPRLRLLAASWGSRRGGDVELARLAAQTAAVLALLAAEYDALRGGWALLAAKAETWLTSSGAASAAGCGLPRECVDAADLVAVRWGQAAPYGRNGVGMGSAALDGFGMGMGLGF